MAKLPAYKQLYIDLKNDIKSKKYKPGTFLPTETEIGEKYHVSRTTVRKAISLLTSEGYISVTQGRGTQVLDISTSQPLNKITSFTETLKQRGYKVTTQGLAIEKISAPDFLVKIFSLKENDEVYHIQRVQCADGKPICIVENYLVASMVPNLQIQESNCVSLYAYLEENYGIIFDHAVERITATNASFTNSQILNIPLNSPLLHSNRITYVDQRAFEYASLYVIAERYEYQIYLDGRHQETP